MQGKGSCAQLALGAQLIGNLDEVTDVRLLGDCKKDSPSRFALATNSPLVRIFNADGLSCEATLTGHHDTVLAMDAAALPGGASLLASGAKDNTVCFSCRIISSCKGKYSTAYALASQVLRYKKFVI